jgi:hypothetical protein
MQVRSSTLFQSSIIQVGAFEMRPTTDTCGEIQVRDGNVMTLPVAGVFAKHERPKHHVVATPSHAVLIASRAPYRLSFPGKIGDRALLLRFDDDLIPDVVAARRKMMWPAHLVDFVVTLSLITAIHRSSPVDTEKSAA